MSIRKEKEDKFLLFNFPNNVNWEKRVLVYQFFYENNTDGNKQLKIVFNFSTQSVNICTVEKKILSSTESIKNTRYIEIEKIKLKDLINTPFVLKKRYIKCHHYLDYYIFSNGRCKYILEIEDDYLIDNLKQTYEIDRNVSAEQEYLNENMTINFDLNQYEKLMLLLKIFTDKYND